MRKAVVSYIPAIHQGYIKFLHSQRPDIVYILSSHFFRETPRLERDIRALEPSDVAKMITNFEFVKDSHVLETEADLDELKKFDEIVLPDEDVNRKFVSNHLDGSKIVFVNGFLRWDMKAVVGGNQVPDGHVIVEDKFAQDVMGEAQVQARRSPDWWRQVGAVVVKDRKVLFSTHNRPLPSDDYSLGAFGDPRGNFDAGQDIEITTALHAEVAIIAQAARAGVSLNATSIYVTTFPCPPCARALVVAGIDKVFYAEGYSLLDAQDILESHSVELIRVAMKKPPAL